MINDKIIISTLSVKKVELSIFFFGTPGFFLGLSKPVPFFKTAISIFKNCKTPVLKPGLKFFVEKLNKTRK
jgi:hypothetical protein